MDRNVTAASPDNEGPSTASPRRTYEAPTLVALGTAQEAVASFQSFIIP
jgi:hypothetical protein